MWRRWTTFSYQCRLVRQCRQRWANQTVLRCLNRLQIYTRERQQERKELKHAVFQWSQIHRRQAIAIWRRFTVHRLRLRSLMSFLQSMFKYVMSLLHIKKIKMRKLISTIVCMPQQVQTYCHQLTFLLALPSFLPSFLLSFLPSFLPCFLLHSFHLPFAKSFCPTK